MKKFLKWVVELKELDLVFKSRTFIKGQELADFVAEFTIVLEIKVAMVPIGHSTWSLFSMAY